MIEREPNTINITLDEYEELRSDQKFLWALQAAGVDNWEGYDMAREIDDE